MTSHLHDELEVDYLTHFNELRTRLLYGLLALAVAIIVGWLIYDRAYELLASPVQEAIRAHHGVIMTRHPAEGFMTKIKLSVALGLVLASPVILWQLWAFVRPGLTVRERKMVGPIVPAICFLFLFGAAIAYLMMPAVMGFFVGFVPPGVVPNLDYEYSIDFPLKILLSFGIAFQLPIVLLGLVLVGVLSPKLLLDQWRAAIVIIGIIAAVITPTTDPFSWTVMTVPLVILYFVTVLLAYRFARGRQAADSLQESDST